MKKEYLTLIGCCLVHLGIGSIYSISILYKIILDITSWDVSILVTGFAITILVLGLTSAFHQKLLLGCDKKQILGKTVFVYAISQIIGYMSIVHGYILAYFIYSVLLGFAIGLLYVMPINISTTLGFRRTGLASGIVIFCFGLGSYISSKLFSIALTINGLYSVLILYLIYSLIMLIGVYLIKVQSKVESSKSFIRDRLWYIVAIVYFLEEGIGIALLSNLTILSLERGLEMAVAVSLVAYGGVANSIGRIIYSAMSDFIGKGTMIVFILLVQCLSIIGLTIWSSLWFWSILLILSVYGGFFAIMPGLMKELYKSKGTMAYSELLIMWGIAGFISPIVFNYLNNNIILILIMSVVTLVLSIKILRG